MSVINSDNPGPRQVHDSLIDRLDEFRQQVRGRLLFEGVSRVLLAVFLLALATFVLDRVFRLSLPARIGMDVCAAIAVSALAWREIVSPLRLKLDPLTLAAALDRMSGRTDGFITSRVGSLLELPEVMNRSGHPSTAMLQMAAAQAHAALSEINFDERLNDNRRNWAFAGILVSVLFPIVLASSAPQSTRLWAARLLEGSNQPWPQKTYLQVTDLKEDNVIAVPRGEAYVLRVQATANSQMVPEIVSIRFREGAANRVEANLTSFGTNDFRYEFASITSPIEVELTGNDAVLGPFTLRPADRPRITDLKLIAQHPTEATPTTYNFNGDTDLSFLPRTHIQLQFTANTPIAGAHLKSSTTKPSQADLRQLDATHFAMEWTHNTPVQLEVELTSQDAHLASSPTTLGVGLKVDQPPRITLGYTGVKLRVTSKATIPLTIDARDDYGLAAVNLIAKTESPDPNNAAHIIENTITTPLFGPVTPAIDKENQQKAPLKLESLNQSVGGQITVNASATDACYTGAQTTLSRPITFRIVAAEELFREILQRQQAERAKFRKQADEVRSMREEMNLAATADAVQKLARRHRVMQHEVSVINTALSDTLTEMKLNQLGTAEAYELMQKNVLTPMQQLNDELLTPQKDALDGLSPTDTTAMGAVQARQDEEFDHMNQILHQMSQWDSFVDVLNQLNEVIKLQDQAEQKTKELKKKETEGIFDPK